MMALSWLIPLLPLAGFLVNGIFGGRLSRNLVSLVGCGSLLGSFILSLSVFLEACRPGFLPVTLHLFDFIRAGSLKIPFDLLVDQLSILFMLVITGVGFLIHLYSISYMKGDQGYSRYFSYLNLFVFSMLLLVMGANYVILFIGWEGVGLCSYLLIGFWYTHEAYNQAANKAFIMNRIGDLGFLIGIFLMIRQFGSVVFSDVFSQAGSLGPNAPVLIGITLLLLFGATGKSAQIPLYTWLPDAMAGPTPVSALIHAATMVTAGVYMIARSHVLYSLAPVSQTVVAVLGLSTALFAASIALKQYDIKKILAYSTISQLGYMFLGLGVGSYSGAVFHVMTHAFFKALLFLGAGSVIHALGGEQDIRRMGGLGKKLPVTQWTFLVACLAIAGVPPFSGFFSKDEILGAAFGQNPLLYFVGLAGALLTAVYIFRLYVLTFLGTFRGSSQQAQYLHESPWPMTLPLILLAILSLAGGWVGIPAFILPQGQRIEAFLDPVFGGKGSPASGSLPAVSTQWTLLVVSSALVILGILWTWRRFSRKPDPGPSRSVLGNFLQNKGYVDELYDRVLSRPLGALASFFGDFVDRSLVDGLVRGIGRTVQWGSSKIRLLQDGYMGFYLFAMVIGMIILLAIGYFLK